MKLSRTLSQPDVTPAEQEETWRTTFLLARTYWQQDLRASHLHNLLSYLQQIQEDEFTALLQPARAPTAQGAISSLSQQCHQLRQHMQQNAQSFPGLLQAQVAKIDTHSELLAVICQLQQTAMLLALFESNQQWLAKHHVDVQGELRTTTYQRASSGSQLS